MINDGQNEQVLLTQLRGLYFAADCGMCYAIRLTDGRFLLIDSGMGEYDEPEHLLELLCRQSNGIPIIAAWFFTHPHPDHINGFIRLTERCGGRLCVEEIVRRWPTAGECSAGYRAEAFEAAVETLAERGTRVTVPHRGQIWDFPGCRLGMLYTSAELAAEPTKNLNEASLVFRTELCGHRVMWLGDCEKQTAAWLCTHYSPAELQCEFLQVGHHGYYGGSDALYRLIDPQILLWPCPDFWYHTVRKWSCNRYFEESERITHTVVAGQGEYTFRLTPERTELLPADAMPLPQGMRYRAPIEKKSMIALGWSCMTGGDTGCAPLTVDFPETGGVRLRTGTDAGSICALVLPQDTEGDEVLTARLSGRFGEVTGRVGLLWDSRTPNRWDPDAVLWLDAQSGESFDLTLRVDPASRQAVLYRTGKTERVVPCRTGGMFGLNLCMEQAEVILVAVTVSGNGAGAQ